MKLVFEVPDKLVDELVDAHAEAHAIPTKDGVQPVCNNLQWFKRYHIDNWIELVNARRERLAEKLYSKVNQDEIQ